ncbi:MAG: choice-of-anchor M domain-containing protein, partial [Bifidobacteriaceae bacterium]|nr:choice-of-anchor M domain-containing protein [Bifidobacteriaceae bacterium]
SIPLSATQGGVDWKLTDMSGPGEFALYETGSFGEPSVLFATRDGITGADEFTIPKNTHAHGSWAFSEQGVYCLGFTRSAVLADGGAVSDEFTLAVAVGEADVMGVDPANCVPAGVATVPAAPAAPTAAVDGSSVAVSWAAPDDGGSAITGYTVRLLGGDESLTQDVAADATSVVFTDVPAGSWTATVVAANAVGSSEPSPASNAVAVASTPDPGPEPTVPAAPAAPTAAVDGDVVTVGWVAPDDGGSPLTGFTVSLLGGDNPLVRDVGGDATSAVFAGVEPGTYRATVIAVNAVGASAASPESAPVTIEPAASEPDPGEPDPGDPDPGEPGPGAPDPGEPGPGAPDPSDPDPGEPHPDPEVAPVPEGELTGASRGGVDVPDAATPGAQIVVAVPGHAGQQVRVWLHSTPVLLGTVTLDADGRVVVTIPAGTPAGDHRIVVQALDGSLIGWDGIVIRAASRPAKPQPDDEALPVTGADIGWPLIGAAGLLLLGAFARIRARERRTRPANT